MDVKLVKEAVEALDIEAGFVSLKDGVLCVEMYGECAGCHTAALETEQRVLDGLAGRFGEIEKVRAVRHISNETLDFARKILCKGER